MAEKKYVPCWKVLEMYPEFKTCERPARVGGDGRCPLHPLEKLWPE